ncbi:Nepenthesin [Bertholletia excelsa]
MASHSSLTLIHLFSILALASSSTYTTTITTTASATNTVTLSLSPITATTANTNPWQKLNQLAYSSIARARHLKHPHRHTSTSSLIKTPLFARSYGGYSVSLRFGTPPQTLSFIMDTGSSLVWFPCTRRYICLNCSFAGGSSTKVSPFIPKLSSSAKLLDCKNPKCGWVFGADVLSHCPICHKSSGNCTRTCPAYGIKYGSGSTSGLLLSETLKFPGRFVKDFVVGCSILSTQQPSGTGIAGFGRGRESLPVQMGLKKFSYCLVSHRFDDTPESSDMVLVAGRLGSGERKIRGLRYTSFLNNRRAPNPAFRNYYYVNLRTITVGGERAKVPRKFLVPGYDGNGGTIVDSGTSFTFMAKTVFEAVANELEKQMANYSRAADVENLSGLRPCFNISGKQSVVFPELVFHFNGGAKMELPLDDYFAFLGDVGVVCMTIVTEGGAGGPAADKGPAIILGNYQQQNFYLEYDLEKERLGFKRQICKS